MFWTTKKEEPPVDRSWSGRLKKVIDGYRDPKKRGRRPRLAKVPDEQVRAFLAPTVYVMLSDGERQDAEEIQLMAMLATAPILRGSRPDDFGDLIESIEQELGTIGAKADEAKMLALIKPLPAELRGSAYAYAVRMVYADQHREPEEDRALADVQRWLHVLDTEAERIDRVMRLLITAPPLA